MQTHAFENPKYDGGTETQAVAVTISVGEAATILGLSEPTIYRLIERRLLKNLPGLRHKRITRRSLNAYCAGTFADL